MKREYRTKFPEIKDVERIKNMDIRGIYVIPDKAYNGFWGKNGYKSFDFVFEGKEEGEAGTLGWCHWEGDVIDIISKEFGISVDCGIGEDYLRFFCSKGIILEGLEISNLTIKAKENTDDKQQS